MSTYIVFLHKAVAEGRAISGEAQYMATLEIEAPCMEISELGLVFKNAEGVVLYAFGHSQWYSVKRKDFNSITNITPSDSLAVVKEIKND